MIEMTNRQVVEAWMEALATQGIRTACERYIREDCRQHNPDAGEGREGAIAYLEAVKARGAEANVQRILVDGDHVLIHFWMRYADGNLDQSVADIWRVEGGKLAEHWSVAKEVPEVCTTSMF